MAILRGSCFNFTTFRGQACAGARNWAGSVAAAKGWKAALAVAGPDKVYYEDRKKLEANTRILTEVIPQLAP